MSGSPGGGRPGSPAPALTGVLETALYVRDLEASEAFWGGLLGARMRGSA